MGDGPHGGAWSGPVPAPRREGVLRRLRRQAQRHPFRLLVLLPTLLAGLYLFGLAAPQYESEARFIIRGRQAQPGDQGRRRDGMGHRLAAEPVGAAA